MTSVDVWTLCLNSILVDASTSSTVSDVVAPELFESHFIYFFRTDRGQRRVMCTEETLHDLGVLDVYMVGVVVFTENQSQFSFTVKTFIRIDKFRVQPFLDI